MDLLRIKPRYRIYTKFEDYFYIYKAILTGSINKGKHVKKFENDLDSYMRVKHSICMPQGRVGIYMAIKASVEPGKKVILSPYTIADVINMVIVAGAIPVFTDIERETCNIDPDKIESNIDKDTVAVMITHLQGLTCDMDKIVDICDKNNLLLIEDASQAFGAKYKGKRIGTFGSIGIFSFGMYKNITAFYGGMLVTNSNSINDVVRKEMNTFPYSEVSWLHKKVRKGALTDISTSKLLFQSLVFWIFKLGHLKNIRFINKFVETELDLSRKNKIPESYLRRMTPLQAKLASGKLNAVDKNNHLRINNARKYYEGLKDIPELILPPFKEDESHIYTYFPIQYKERKSLIRWMIKNNIDVGPQHLRNTADLPAFKDFFKDCPNARKTANEVILLPTYTKYSSKMIEHTIMIINKFFKY